MVSIETQKHCIEQLRSGSTKDMSGALFGLYHATHSIEEVANQVESVLVELLDNPEIEDLYWRTCIEFGIRTYANLQNMRFAVHSDSTISQKFCFIANRVLEIDNDSILGFALVAIREDAPTIAFALLEKVTEIRMQKSNVQLLIPLLDSCIKKLLENGA